MINGAGKQAINKRAFLVTNSFAASGRELETISAPAADPLKATETALLWALRQKISNLAFGPKLSETER